jgi:hypothetical protein
MTVATEIDADELRDAVRGLLADVTIGTEIGPSEWQATLDAGWLALGVSAERGGLGQSMLTVAMLLEEVGRCCQNRQGGNKLHWIQIARREALLKNDSSEPVEGIGSDASTEVLAGCSRNRLQTGWRGFRNNHRYDDPLSADPRLALANECTVGSTITETSLDMYDGTLFCYHRHSGNSTSKSLDVAPCCHDFLLWDSPDLGADLFFLSVVI